jgi:hypothetical protein
MSITDFKEAEKYYRKSKISPSGKEKNCTKDTETQCLLGDRKQPQLKGENNGQKMNSEMDQVSPHFSRKNKIK